MPGFRLLSADHQLPQFGYFAVVGRHLVHVVGLVGVELQRVLRWVEQEAVGVVQVRQAKEEDEHNEWRGGAGTEPLGSLCFFGLGLLLAQAEALELSVGRGLGISGCCGDVLR